jgi:hypothetical protein
MHINIQNVSWTLVHATCSVMSEARCLCVFVLAETVRFVWRSLYQDTVQEHKGCLNAPHV